MDADVDCTYNSSVILCNDCENTFNIALVRVVNSDDGTWFMYLCPYCDSDSIVLIKERE